jgi:hypothetical protein
MSMFQNAGKRQAQARRQQRVKVTRARDRHDVTALDPILMAKAIAEHNALLERLERAATRDRGYGMKGYSNARMSGKGARECARRRGEIGWQARRREMGRG